jgi:hypothetical protein
MSDFKVLKFRVGRDTETGEVLVEIQLDKGEFSGDTFSFQISPEAASKWAHSMLTQAEILRKPQ